MCCLIHVGHLIFSMFIVVFVGARKVLPRNALPTVVLGEHQRSVPDETPFTRVVRVARVIPHEDYDGAGDSKNNDIGLVELASPVELGRSPGIAPICPPSRNISDAGQSVVTLG